MKSCWAALFSSGHSSVKVGRRTFKIVSTLGEGGYSFVYLVRDAATGKEYALKQILAQTSEQLEQAKNEIDVLRLFNHPNLLGLVDSEAVKTQTGSQINLLFEAYKEGTLVDLVESSASLHPAVVLNIFLQVCRGCQCMHLPKTKGGTRYAHRDIKPHNVLLSSQSEDALDPYHAVLMDFGSARPARVSVTSRSGALKAQEEAEAHTTATYRSPELFDCPSEFELDERTDVWSLGCLLYYMCYGESPFEYVLNQAGGSLALAVISGKMSWGAEGKGYHPLVEDLCRLCLRQDLDERPFVDQVLEEAYRALDAVLEETRRTRKQGKKNQERTQTKGTESAEDNQI